MLISVEIRGSSATRPRPVRRSRRGATRSRFPGGRSRQGGGGQRRPVPRRFRYLAPTRDAHSTRCMSASEPSQLLEVSGQPAGDPGVYCRWPNRSKLRMTSKGSAGATFKALKVENTKSSGVLNLRASASQDSGDSISAAYTCGKSPSRLQKGARDSFTAAGGGSSATKWRTSLVAMKLAVSGRRAKSVSTASP